MPDSSILRPVKHLRLSREEKARETYMRILESAAQVVGEEGYAEASVSKITRLAGVAQGTFYNYFESRQHIFDKLLPYMGRQMLDHIRRSMPGGLVGAAREEARLRAFFGYLNAHPSFYRILSDAEVFPPTANATLSRVRPEAHPGTHAPPPRQPR